MLYFKLYPFTLLRQCCSFTFLFMYLGELLQYYQSSNNLPQSAHTLDFDLKSWFVLFNTSSRSTRCWLASVFVALVSLGPQVALLVVDFSPSQSLLLWFALLGTLSHSNLCRLVSVSLFAALVCLGPRVVLLDVDLSLSQSLLLWFGLLRTSSRSARCSLVPVNLSRFVLLNTSSYSARSWLVSVSSFFFVLLNTSSRSAHCRLVSVSIFAALVSSTPQVDLLVVDLSRQSRQSVSTFRALCWNLNSHYLLFSCLWRLSKYSYCRRTGSCKLMFHSPKLLSIRPFSHRFEFGFSLAVFCNFVIAFLKRLPSTQPSHPVAKRTVVDAHISNSLIIYEENTKKIDTETEIGYVMKDLHKIKPTFISIFSLKCI